ncbi:MAG TPA: glycosyltransferase [Burkholderiales bacterium]|nr:glycosyltransferase [Burkholderiales bacterium]
MRILFTSGPMYGHVNAVLPLAIAAQRAGHEVVVATGADLIPHVERFQLTAWPVGLTHNQAGGNRHDSWLNYFATSALKRAEDLVPRAVAWKPDLVIHEETELAGPTVAAIVGARHYVHGLGLMPPARIWLPFAAAIEAIGHRWNVRNIARTLPEATYLHMCPPALQSPGERMWKHVVSLRPAGGMVAPGDRLPVGFGLLPYSRTVHLTLGTVFHESTDVLESAIASLRKLAFNLVVTVGPGVDPARFGPQPAHVLIERYVSHALLLPHCCLVVSQGGAGIMFGALSHGLPQLVIPQGGDQFMNAEACQKSGAALSLAPAEISGDAIAAAVERLLIEPAFTATARAIRAEIQSMPDAETTLDILTATLARCFHALRIHWYQKN